MFNPQTREARNVKPNATPWTLPGVCLALAPTLHAGDLVIELQGIRSNEGRAYVAVHQKSPHVEFPDTKGSIARLDLSAREGTVTVVLKDLPEGDYAVSAFHDENANGELDKNVVGIPTEGYAFSNDAFGFLGPPDFDDAAVTVGKDSVTATARLVY